MAKNNPSAYTANVPNAPRETAYRLPSSDVEILKGKRILQYPIGLGNTALDEYNKEQQFMMFKINTDEKTTSLREDVKLGDVAIPINNRGGTRIASTRASPKDADPDMKIKFGEAALSGVVFVKQTGMVRLDKVIILPMPNDHRVDTTLTYSEQEQSSLTKLADTMNTNAGGVVGGWITAIKNKALAKSINAAGISTSYESLLAEEGLLINPKMEVMYKGFSFRRFSFDYHFAPKSSAESELVRDIIETFRYYALPELVKGKLFYVFPAEFEISFMQGQRDNPNIPRITTSVLERIVVNYSPNSVWSTLPNGGNASISMSLNFYEVELVDRSRVYNAESIATSGY